VDKKYYVGERPKHKKLQYILLTLFAVSALVFLASLFIPIFTPYVGVEYVTYVSLILVAISVFTVGILGICEPEPLHQWSTKRCLAWLYANRPEEDLLRQ